MAERPVFYYDFNSPYAWLAAERVNSVLPVPPVWQPISFGHILKATERRPWSFFDELRAEGMAEIERRAALREATEKALQLGVVGVPTVAVGDRRFWGDDKLEEAAAALA